MPKERLMAFTDGVIAIIITIMVLELKVPHGSEWADLTKLWPLFSAYVLSFLYVAIYWNNHHHLFQTTDHVDGAILWANMHLLFWLSLVPIATGWVGEHYVSPAPAALNGLVLFMCAIAYTVLQLAIIRHTGTDGTLARALGTDWKGKLSLLCYVIGIALTVYWPLLSLALFAAIALVWLIPDPRIERVVVPR